MDGAEHPAWFLGDLDDPWVVAIAKSIPDGARACRQHCPGDLPGSPFDRARPPRVVIIHRHHLTDPDAQRLADWRNPGGARPGPALILCFGPFVRYDELERWSRLVDRMVPEATAAEVLPRLVADLVEVDASPDRGSPADLPEFRIEVAGGELELGQVLVEACRAAGYRAEALDDRGIGAVPHARHPGGSATERVLTVWEVPVLEPDWAQRLERRSLQSGPVIALLGFADRAIVARAKAGGAVACLELPCNLDDLLDLIDRIVRRIPPASWPLPARIEPPHPVPQPPRRRAAGRNRSAESPSPPWSDRGPLPRIP